MTSKVQLDRDIISGIFKHNLAQQRDVSNFKLGLVSKKCLLALKTACDVECKGAKLSFYEVLRFSSTRDLDLNEFHKISEPEFWLLKEWSICELEFGDGNDQRYLQLYRKIKGFGLKRIFLATYSDYNSNPDHRSEILRIISESSGTLKELCHVPYIFLRHLPHTLKLEKLTTSGSIPMNSDIKDFLKLSAKEVKIDTRNCYLPSRLLKNINAQTLHVNASGSWAEGVEKSSVEIQTNPSIQEISIVLRNDCDSNPNKIYDIKKIIESIQKGYPNLILLKIQDFYDRGYNLSSEDLIQFFTKLFTKTEALLSELQDLSFSIQMKQDFAACHTRQYGNFVYEISRKDEWKDFEEIKEYPQEDRGQKYLSLKKSTQFGEGKSLEFTFYTSAMTRENNSDYDSYDDD